jgi:hypothetical protein
MENVKEIEQREQEDKKRRRIVRRWSKEKEKTGK